MSKRPEVVNLPACKPLHPGPALIISVLVRHACDNSQWVRILNKPIGPFFDRPCAEKQAQTGPTERNTQNSTPHQSWHQQPSTNTKRGKPHRAALKAGLGLDEPPQLARALATGAESI